MNSLRTVCLLMGLIALASANQISRAMRWHGNRNSIRNSFRPTEWLPVSELESLPPMHEVTLQKLEEMSLQEGADLVNKMYHLSQAGRAIEPSYVPNPSEIPCFYITPDNKKVHFQFNKLSEIAKEEKEFGNQEVTIFITGLPEKTETIRKANRKLIQAYIQRYNGQTPELNNVKYEDEYGGNNNPSMSEEDLSTSGNSRTNKPSGSLVVIELGNILHTVQDFASLDVERTGIEIGDILVNFTDDADVPPEFIHVIGSYIAAHVAGAAGRQYNHKTGHQLRRITGLDPSKLFAQSPKSLRGLARGDAEFVDVIHTSAYGLGIPSRSGDVDFYPNGPGEGVPGADNVVEATMRAIRYFAESVVPGNERNFPAVGAISLKQYKDQKGNGRRVYMGINTDYDVKGDYILQVNAKSPFGRSTLSQRQQNNHDSH